MEPPAFITVFTRALDFSLSVATWTQSTRMIILNIILPSSPVSSRWHLSFRILPPKPCISHLPVRTTWPVNLTLLHLIPDYLVRITRHEAPHYAISSIPLLTIIHIENPTRYNSVSNFYFIFIWSSTCFGRHSAHYQEPKTALAASGFAWYGGRLLDV